jgi:hypothetical protein
MKKSLLGLLVGLSAFLCGVFIAEIFRFDQRPVPEPLFEKEIVDIPLFEIAPTDLPENVEVIEENKTQGIYGWYSLDDHGKMTEVSMILLSVDNFDEEGNPTKKMNLSSGVYTTLSDDIDEGFAEDAWTEMEGNKVKFKTKKLKGIIYSFEGTFFKNKTSGENGEALLRGTLRKFVKGKKVAEISGDFTYYEPYCLH